MDLIITILPVVTKDLPISPQFTPYIFLGLLNAVLSSFSWGVLALVHTICRKICPVLQTLFDVIPPKWFYLTTQMHLGDRGHYPRGQLCSSSVASQGKPRHRTH